MGLVIKKNIIGNYYLTAPDDDLQLSLAYGKPNEDFYSGIIESTVFAVGYNKDYIIAKQHPRKFPNDLDRTITNYYILPITNNYKWNLIGPLTLIEFNSEKKRLKISKSLNFTIEFENLK
jgi:hypothetical protein